MIANSGKTIIAFAMAGLFATSAFAQQSGIRKIQIQDPPEQAPQVAAPVPMTFEHIELRPKDEANRDEEFLAFRTQLLAAIEARDLPFLLAHIDENVKCSFGGCAGIAAFKTEWKLDTNPQESKLWGELKRVLSLGGTFKRDVFTAPWTFSEFPSEFDASKFAVVTGRSVNIRQRPRSNAAPMGKVTYLVVRDLQHEETKEIVEVIGNDSYTWQKIGLPDGSAGYVYGKFFRKPLDYRAAFKPIDDVWKLTMFVAGD